MRRLFSNILIVFFFLTFLFLVKSQVFASVKITANPFVSLIPSTQEAKDYITGNVFGIPSADHTVVTENTKTVHITFTGLSGEYAWCPSADCLLLGKKSPIGGTFSVSDAYDKLPKIQISGPITFDVCADGENLLKLAENGTDCANGDFFHGGHVYAIVLLNKDSIVDESAFYVSRYYPLVFLNPGIIKPGEKINVQIIGTRRPHGSDYDPDNNNYAVEIASADDPDSIFSQDCIDVPDNDTGATVSLNGKPEGDYIIKINEKTHEGNLLHSRCSAEFTYYWIKVRVRSEEFWKKNCDLKNGVTNCLNSTIEIIPDPNGTDVPGEKRGKNAPPPPCAVGNWDPLSSDTCPTLNTAVGKIDTAPQTFIGSVFGLVLGLSGGIALLLIIYSGYQLIASQGNPEKLEAARQQLVSAIVGLLFIIFALVILQVIGVDILNIPGITK